MARSVHRQQDDALGERFRQRFPFSPEPYCAQANDLGQFIGPAFLVDDRRIVARLGPPWEEDAHFVLVDGLATQVLEKLRGLGRSIDRQIWASADDDAIVTYQGFQGSVIARFPFPDGTEGLPPMLSPSPDPLARRCDELIPFNDGRRVLLRNPTGVYLLDYRGARRLHPQVFDEDGPYTWRKNRGEGSLDMDMVHMALSPDEQWIAVGDQDSEHCLLSGSGEQVRTISPCSSYPHYAVFSNNSGWVIFNSCHFNNGVTVATSMEAMAAEPVVIHDELRIYAGASISGSRGDELLVGSNGYIYGLSSKGGQPWEHHVGGTLSALDCSRDGLTILAATCGGYMALLDQNAEGPGPYRVGNSPYRERWRWIFWKGEGEPVRW